MARAPRLLVATAAGVLFVYALDAAEGGECALLRQHQFLDAPPHAHAHAPHAPTAHEGNLRLIVSPALALSSGHLGKHWD